ncbi:uncharacterized protein BDZ99DRAFT_448593 [Mytilinidion resinicola]|uniref:Restriction of telomere capping protein 4 n=1 Tax=Mytilinidion resinicola TaxID=574789 RepID=A0A6A6YG08_9PEZI|nr:uncharacterized protein BDZ99DRAFT_448593 [Mytilinidion resinicola]KAF2806954.1 hypothetical protein BDZ99DRAFT_448593 [Mytilinidion resinicola]
MYRSEKPRQSLLSQFKTRHRSSSPTAHRIVSPTPPPLSQEMQASEVEKDPIYGDPVSSSDERPSSPARPPPSLPTAQNRGPIYPQRRATYTTIRKEGQDESAKEIKAKEYPKKGSQGSPRKRSAELGADDNDTVDEFGMPEVRKGPRRATGSQGSTGKMSGVIKPEDDSSLDDFGEMGSQRARKRVMSSYGKNIGPAMNIHHKSRAKGKGLGKPGFKNTSALSAPSPKTKKEGFKNPKVDLMNPKRDTKKDEWIRPEMPKLSSVRTRPPAPGYKNPSEPIVPAIPKMAFRMPETMPAVLFKTTQAAHDLQASLQRSNSSSPLSSPNSSILEMSSQAQSDLFKADSPPLESSPEPIGSICPMCRKPVDGAHLYTFAAEHGKNFKLNVGMQQVFCRQHKQKSAEDDYAARGYPKIVWHKLEQRMGKHAPHLEAVLEGKEKSAYRDKLEQSVRTGSNRNLLSAIMTDEFKQSTTGYYGARGARVMMEYITKTFAPQIRRLAPTDKLISSGGMSKFVQSVLLPELVIRLVIDDMKVNEERAKEIIGESGEVGDLVHEEDDDAVRRDEHGNKYIVVPENMDSEAESDGYDEDGNYD